MFNIKKYNEINDFLKKSSNSAKIVAISKNHPLQSVLEAINAGVYIFGENRVQEAQDKIQSIKQNNPKIELHLTGPLQSNKVKVAISLFDVFHTLDREKIAREFSKHLESLVNKKIFLQVNIGKEKTKSGIFPEAADDCSKKSNCFCSCSPTSFVTSLLTSSLTLSVIGSHVCLPAIYTLEL